MYMPLPLPSTLTTLSTSLIFNICVNDNFWNAMPRTLVNLWVENATMSELSVRDPPPTLRSLRIHIPQTKVYMVKFIPIDPASMERLSQSLHELELNTVKVAQDWWCKLGECLRTLTIRHSSLVSNTPLRNDKAGRIAPHGLHVTLNGLQIRNGIAMKHITTRKEAIRVARSRYMHYVSVCRSMKKCTAGERGDEEEEMVVDARRLIFIREEGELVQVYHLGYKIPRLVSEE